MEHNFQTQPKPIKKVSLKIAPLPFRAKEAMNMLRGNIQMSGYQLKTIAIISGIKHEGKSSIAFQLARSMAALNKKTLYLDCDIRNSMTVSRYHVEGKRHGISEFLCGRAGIQDIIFGTDDEYMDIVFSGAVAPNPSELFSGSLFQKLMEYLKQKYDYIIVDTPPVCPVIDGVLIAKQCDGTILVVESAITERATALHAKQQLEYAGVKILGSVLNKADAGGHYGRYGYGRYGYGRYGYGKYGYGYGYGEDEESGRKRKKRKK